MQNNLKDYSSKPIFVFVPSSSFVQEFASSPADGITLLLETLRGVQVAQNTPPSGQTGPRVGTRRAALDELGCVECLAACGERCADAPRLLMEAQPGLLALAVCLTSSLNRSRVLALQVNKNASLWLQSALQIFHSNLIQGRRPFDGISHSMTVNRFTSLYSNL